MTILQLLPKDATVSLVTAAKSIQMEPSHLLMLLWYRGCEICLHLLDGSVYVRREENGKIGLPNDAWWFDDASVRNLVDSGETLALMKDVSSGTYRGNSFPVTLNSLSVRVGEVARHCLEPPSTEQGQKDLSPKRERTLLKMIGALLAMRYRGPAYENSNGGVNVSRMAERMQQDMAKANINDDGLKDRTLRDLIPLAMEAIKENMVPEKGGDG